MLITLMVDASHCPKTGAAGYGYWIASDRGKQGGGGPLKSPVSTSSAAEMLAICNALHIACKGLFVLQGDRVLVQTDCVAAIQAFEGKRTSKNEQEREASKFLWKLRRRLDFGVSFRHVKGHTDRAEARFVTNNRCDERAKEGMGQARLTLAKGLKA